MLRIVDETLNRLRNGEDLKVVRESYRSQSQLSEGFRIYNDELEKKIAENRLSLAAVSKDLDQATGALDQLNREKQDLTKDVESLRSEKAGLQEDIENKRVEIQSLDDKAEALQKRNFTQNIVTRLSESVDLNGPEVWRVLESVDARARLEEEIDLKRNVKDQVEREVSRSTS